MSLGTGGVAPARMLIDGKLVEASDADLPDPQPGHRAGDRGLRCDGR